MPQTQPPLLPLIVEHLALADPKLGLRIRNFVLGGDQKFHERAEAFFHSYKAFIETQGKSLEFGVDCFLRLQRSVEVQRIKFLQSGRYQNTSFDEVNRSVYANPEVMQSHMHGLVFAQFLWPDQYRRFQFFSETLPLYAKTGRYLEIGGGHALYVAEAVRALPGSTFDVVDISPTSLEMARGIAREPKINYYLMDVFDFPDEPIYDFITMGEVLEHVEHPQRLLSKFRSLLAPGGVGYITTPANAPMLDHIYLFRNAQEIRDMLANGGFRIEQEARQYSVEISESLAERMKLPLMFAAFVRPA